MTRGDQKAALLPCGPMKTYRIFADSSQVGREVAESEQRAIEYWLKKIGQTLEQAADDNFCEPEDIYAHPVD